MEETREYLIENLFDIAEYRARYPNLIFTPISSSLFILQVPPGANEEFESLNREIRSIYFPLLYGLNAISAVEQSNISVFHTYPFGELRGNGVIIGFIDTGIQYTNTLFKYEDNTTRIIEIWDQSIEGSGISHFNYGTVYTEEQINEALRSSNPLSIVRSTDENGHGTFLAGVAAGNERGVPGGYVGGAPDASIAVVKLKPAQAYLREFYLINEDAVAYQDNDYLAGINYLLELAVRRRMPIVICTGLGTNQGGHDGNTLVEKYLQETSTFENVIFVQSAGNEANQGHHYSGTIAQGGTSLFEVNVGANEKGFVMNIWGNSPDKLTISVRSPLGGITQKIPINAVETQEYTFPLENTRLQVRYMSLQLTSGDEVINLRFVDPTPGIWAITVYGESVINGTYNVWLPREGFIETDTRFLQPDVSTTITTPGNATKSMTIGAYNDLDQSIYAASSRGPTRSMVIEPTLIAPGVNVQGPNLIGGYTTYSGTSVAAAVTASGCVLLLEWAVINRNLLPINTRVAKTILIRGARRTPNTIYPNNVEGYGKLDLQNSLILV